MANGTGYEKQRGGHRKQKSSTLNGTVNITGQGGRVEQFRIVSNTYSGAMQEGPATDGKRDTKVVASRRKGRDKTEVMGGLTRSD